MKYRSEMHFQVLGFAGGGVSRDRKRPRKGQRTTAVVVEDGLGHDF